MKNITLYLIKAILICLFFIVAILLMAIIGLKFTFLVMFFIIAKHIWSYKPVIHEVKEEVYDYYSVFGLNRNFDESELQLRYNYEVEKLNNNHTLSIESRKELLELFQDTFETLNNPVTKAKFDLEFENHLTNVKAVEQKNANNKINVKRDVKEMISFKKANIEKIKTALIIGVAIAFVIDLVSLAN